jgi:hypothetical protein
VDTAHEACTGHLQAAVFPTPLRGHPTVILHAAFTACGPSLTPLQPLPSDYDRRSRYVSTYLLLSGLYVLPTGEAEAPALQVIAEAAVQQPNSRQRPYYGSAASLDWLAESLQWQIDFRAINEAIAACWRGGAPRSARHCLQADARELFSHVRSRFRLQGGDPARSHCPSEWFLLGLPGTPQP